MLFMPWCPAFMFSSPEMTPPSQHLHTVQLYCLSHIESEGSINLTSCDEGDKHLVTEPFCSGPLGLLKWNEVCFAEST